MGVTSAACAYLPAPTGLLAEGRTSFINVICAKVNQSAYLPVRTERCSTTDNSLSGATVGGAPL